jgi:hypothetical protein
MQLQNLLPWSSLIYLGLARFEKLKHVAPLLALFSFLEHSCPDSFLLTLLDRAMATCTVMLTVHEKGQWVATNKLPCMLALVMVLVNDAMKNKKWEFYESYHLLWHILSFTLLHMAWSNISVQ